MKVDKTHYLSPQTEVVEVSSEQIICASPVMFFYVAGSAGEYIEEEEIINGGSF